MHLAALHNQEALTEMVQRSLVWPPDSHSLFPLAFRKGVSQVCRLKVALDRQHPACAHAFNQMDNDLWHIVIGQLGRDWRFKSNVDVHVNDRSCFIK